MSNNSDQTYCVYLDCVGQLEISLVGYLFKNPPIVLYFAFFDLSFIPVSYVKLHP